MNYLIITAGGKGERIKLKENKIFADLNNYSFSKKRRYKKNKYNNKKTSIQKNNGNY